MMYDYEIVDGKAIYVVSINMQIMIVMIMMSENSFSSQSGSYMP